MGAPTTNPDFKSGRPRAAWVIRRSGSARKVYATTGFAFIARLRQALAGITFPADAGAFRQGGPNGEGPIPLSRFTDRNYNVWDEWVCLRLWRAVFEAASPAGAANLTASSVVDDVLGFLNPLRGGVAGIGVRAVIGAATDAPSSLGLGTLQVLDAIERLYKAPHLWSPDVLRAAAWVLWGRAGDAATNRTTANSLREDYSFDGRDGGITYPDWNSVPDLSQAGADHAMDLVSWPLDAQEPPQSAPPLQDGAHNPGNQNAGPAPRAWTRKEKGAAVAAVVVFVGGSLALTYSRMAPSDTTE